MSTELVTEKPQGLKAILNSDNMRQQFALALPKHLTAERFVRVATTAITRNPKLLDCTPESFFKCLLDLSAMGLEPDGRRAHLIPFEDRKRGVVECTLIVDYKGLSELVMRSGLVSSLHADKVCENDEFDYNKGEIVRHRIDFKKSRGNAYAYYVIIRFKDGGEKTEVMPKEDIDRIRNRSRSGNNGPWVTDYDEMAKKTVFRRASKWLSLSAEIRAAVEADDEDNHEMRTVGREIVTGNPFREALPAVETPAIESAPEDEAKDLWGEEGGEK